MGATRMNSTVSGHSPKIKPRNPACAVAAPAYPPIRACEELVGRPSHHVIRSQVMAPASPAIITNGVTSSRLTKPRPTVRATAVPNRNAPAKLKKAAHATA